MSCNDQVSSFKFISKCIDNNSIRGDGVVGIFLMICSSTVVEYGRQPPINKRGVLDMSSIKAGHIPASRLSLPVVNVEDCICFTLVRPLYWLGDVQVGHLLTPLFDCTHVYRCIYIYIY